MQLREIGRILLAIVIVAKLNLNVGHEMNMKGTMIGSALLPFLFLTVPFIIQWSPLDSLIPYDGGHPYTPLVWPGVVVVAAVAVVAAARIKQDWPARRLTQWFNVAVTIVAAVMTLVMIGFALNPT